MEKGRWQSKGGFTINKSTTELKKFSSFKDCFQPAVIQYTAIQFESAFIQTD